MFNFVFSFGRAKMKIKIINPIIVNHTGNAKVFFDQFFHPHVFNSIKNRILQLLKYNRRIDTTLIVTIIIIPIVGAMLSWAILSWAILSRAILSGLFGRGYFVRAILTGYQFQQYLL